MWPSVPTASKAAVALAAGPSVGASHVQRPDSMRSPICGAAASVFAVGPTSMRRVTASKRSIESSTRSMTGTPAIGTGTLLTAPAALASGSADGLGRSPASTTAVNGAKSLTGRLTQRLLVHAIALRHAPADGLDDVAHPGV